MSDSNDPSLVSLGSKDQPPAPAGEGTSDSTSLAHQPTIPAAQAAIPVLQPGARIHQYEIIKFLGEGGMGQVFLARDLRLGRRVAIKFLQAHQSAQPKGLLAEARATARCRHDNIIVIYEVGEHATVPYLVLEYLDGKPLTALIERDQRLPCARAVEIMCSILRALVCAHEAGIIHRDLKPDNVFVTESGAIKVLDFGIAKMLRPPGPELQIDREPAAGSKALAEGVSGEHGTDGAIAGTLQYMSPEQWGGGLAIDHLSDIWACGILLHQMICGHHPLPASRIITTPALDQPMPSMAERAPSDVPRELIQIVDRCLFKAKEQRWQSAAELLAALESFVPGRRMLEPQVADPRSTGEAPFRASDAAKLVERDHEIVAKTRIWSRPRRRMLGLGVVAVLVIGALAVGVAFRTKEGRELESKVADQLHAAMVARDTAREHARQRDGFRNQASKLFDTHQWAEGEELWSRADTLASQEDRQYGLAWDYIEKALSFDPARADLRAQAADLTFERLLRAERDRRFDLAAELSRRLMTYDDGRYQAKLGASARIELEIQPTGTQVWSQHLGAPRQLVGQAPLAALSLPPGSAVLSFEAPGHVAAQLPVLLSRDETLRLRVVLPAVASAPAGMIYVPPGRFLSGSADSTEMRKDFLVAAPLHEVETGGYFIGRNEVTFAEWIEFLDDLPPGERSRRSPSGVSPPSSLKLTEIGPKQWRLELTPTTAKTYTVQIGQKLRYEGRTRRAEQDWTKFPVAAVSYDDAVAFAAWLDHTRRVPGARLCDEYEWERAARGADARKFPGGGPLGPDDANINKTYGGAIGPDEVGSHPGSRSPVGADDMAGNVWEWTRSVQAPSAHAVRGGSWQTDSMSALSSNREHAAPTLRHPALGVRLCVTSH